MFVSVSRWAGRLALGLGLAVPAPAWAGDNTPVAAPQQMLGLQEAVAITLTLLPALDASEANRSAALARVTQARSAMLPSLTGSLAYTRQTANFVLRPGSLPQSLTGSAATLPTRGRSYNYWNTQLQLSQLLFDFGASYYSVSSARALARQTSNAARQAVLEATLATRKAFFAAQGTGLLAEVAQATLANQLRHKQQIFGQVQVGQRPPIDLAQAQTDVSQAQVALIQAQNNDAIAQATLLQAMGVEGLEGAFTLSDDTLAEVQGEHQQGPGLLAEALAHRPEMAALHEALTAQQYTLRGLKSALLPQITAVASVTDAGQELNRLGWNWNAQAVLNWPLINGGNNMGVLQEAQAQLRAVQANINTTRQAIALELHTATLNVSAASLSLRAAKDGVTNATSQLNLAEGRYATGLGGVIELGDAQLAWANANSQEVQAKVALATARASLLKALGRP